MLRLIRRGAGKEGGGTGGVCGGSGYQLFSYLAVWGFFWGGGEREDFKGYVNGALNVGTKGLKVSGDLAAPELRLQLIRKQAKPSVRRTGKSPAPA